MIQSRVEIGGDKILIMPIKIIATNSSAFHQIFFIHLFYYLSKLFNCSICRSFLYFFLFFKLKFDFLQSIVNCSLFRCFFYSMKICLFFFLCQKLYPFIVIFVQNLNILDSYISQKFHRNFNSPYSRRERCREKKNGFFRTSRDQLFHDCSA